MNLPIQVAGIASVLVQSHGTNITRSKVENVPQDFLQSSEAILKTESVISSPLDQLKAQKQEHARP